MGSRIRNHRQRAAVGRAGHQSSQRGQPFVKANCAAIPDTLFESELIGYERGTFTGTQSTRAGNTMSPICRHCVAMWAMLDFMLLLLK